jgi:hypothetical protein
VRQTLRILRASVILLSLLLCMASLAFWIRSRHVRDTLTLSPFPIKWYVSTDCGTVFLIRDRAWFQPADLRPGTNLLSYERSFLGFGKKQSLQSHSWPVQGPGSIIYGTIIKTYFIPLWFCSAIFSILPLIQYPRLLRRLLRKRRGLCLHCGYDLRASANKCPECGRLNLRRSTRPRVTILL